MDMPPKGWDVFRGLYVPPGYPGSGPGSTPDTTIGWRKFIENILSTCHPAVFLDWGCGDWQHSKLVNWGSTRYIGVDIVPELISRLNAEHGKLGVEFHLHSPQSGEKPGELIRRICPVADIAMSKDVLQHLSNSVSEEIISALVGTGADVLLVNDVGQLTNVDGDVGGCRHIDPREPPFSRPARPVLTFFSKVCFLLAAEPSRLPVIPTVALPGV